MDESAKFWASQFNKYKFLRTKETSFSRNNGASSLKAEEEKEEDVAVVVVEVLLMILLGLWDILYNDL